MKNIDKYKNDLNLLKQLNVSKTNAVLNKSTITLQSAISDKIKQMIMKYTMRDLIENIQR